MLKSIARPRRARPAAGLDDWARRRGLQPRGNRPQAGHLSVTCPWSEDVLFSVARGPFPLGAEGVVCHEARLYPADTENGSFSGLQPLRFGGWKAFAIDVASGGWIGDSGHFSVPYTSAGLRVPHLGTLTGLHIARRSERFMPDQDSTWQGTWRGRALDLSCDWVAAVRRHSDARVVDELLRGPVRDLLALPHGPGFELRVEYGQVIVSQQDCLTHDRDLDALVAAAEWLADGVRRICAPPLALAALDAPLPPPRWLPTVRRHPDEVHTLLPVRARLDRVVAIADERGLAVEDPRAFHTAFPAINVPGEAFAVLRGRLPGTELTGRLLSCAERPMYIPEEIGRLLADPGGTAGCDVAVLEVAAATPATAFAGEAEGDLRVAIADGVLTAWRPRRGWQPEGPALDRLAADVATLVRRRGL